MNTADKADREAILKLLPEKVCICQIGTLCECGWRRLKEFREEATDRLLERVVSEEILTDILYDTRFKSCHMQAVALTKSFIVLARKEE